ncbi:MAG: hypothetical protein RL316_941 [Bacteroidota bacterium]|jgi:hypothetical protein
MNGLQGFLIEFMDYVLDNLPFESLSFGNMEYDYTLECVGGRYKLFIYDVMLDHYGMPYRNNLSFEEFDVTEYLK